MSATPLPALTALPAPAPPRRPLPRGQPKRTFHEHFYELRRPSGPPLRITRQLLYCFYDLSQSNLGIALEVCLTTVKKLRVWCGLAQWPCLAIRHGQHPTLTGAAIATLRSEVIARLDPVLEAGAVRILRRAERLAAGQPADDPPPLPAPVEELTEADLACLPPFDGEGAELDLSDDGLLPWLSDFSDLDALPWDDPRPAGPLSEPVH